MIFLLSKVVFAANKGVTKSVILKARRCNQLEAGYDLL